MHWVRNVLAGMIVSLASCQALDNVNLLTLEEDKQLGAELHAEISSNPDQYPILDPVRYAAAYAHLYHMRDRILETSEVRYAEDFEWQVYIIHDDEVLNAFAAPGGYIYVYTGLIRFLEREDDLAGVLGHEIAHADRRHSSQQLTKAYGLQLILEILLGDGGGGAVAQVAAGLVGLEFSREDEKESDEYSVRYLCETDWAADGAASFFEKLLEEGGMQLPEFLSTHPSSEARVEDIRALADELGCDTSPNPNGRYDELLAALP